jgi:uncharacterized membrane protein YdjX (TVP38/TMEM64 family)
MKARLRPLPATLFCLAALGGFLVPLLFAREAGTLVATLLNGLRGTGLIGVCLFVLLEFLVAATGILPASLLGVGAGAVFVFAWGSAFAVLGTFAGAVAGFHIGRRGLRGLGFLPHRLKRSFHQIEDFLVTDGWKSIFLIRLSPLMPFAATSIALGASRLGERDYLIGTSASLPALLGYVYAGSLLANEASLASPGLHPIFAWALALGSIALVVAISRIAAFLLSAGRMPHLAGGTSKNSRRE